MIDLIVWSKDRAAQLDLLLRSIDRFAKDLFNITVIGKCTNDKFASAVSKIIDERPTLNYREENDFYNDTMRVINTADKYVAFSTDDTVIYKELPNIDGMFDLLENKSVCTFSLRYGLNTTLQNYHTGEYQPSLIRYDEVGEQLLTWPHIFYHPNSNYGYPFGLDMHIYRKEVIKNILDNERPFKNSNELESLLFGYRSKCPPLISSFAHSVAVNIPANSISGVTRAGEKHAWDLNVMNDAFLNGKRISLDYICSKKIVGCHQEIPYLEQDCEHENQDIEV